MNTATMAASENEVIDRTTAQEYAFLLTHDRKRPEGSLYACLGTKVIRRTKTGIMFDIHGAAHRVSHCSLDYNAGLDLFELSFYRAGKAGDFDLIENFPALFNDQIKAVFEDYTGLVTSVPRCLGFIN